MRKTIFLIPVLLFAFLAFTACNEEESELGVNLQDPATLFDGMCDTAYGLAYTVFDDSLLTSGTTSALVGCVSDPIFGNSEAIIYSQVGIPSGESVAFDEYCTIDSVVLSLSVTSLYPDMSKSYRNLHFEVYQLAEGLKTDSAYYASDEVEVSNVCFFDDVVRIAQSDTMVVNLKLNQNFLPLLQNRSYSSSQEFIDAVRGIRIRLVNDGTPVIATVNLAAASTRMSVYFQYNATATDSTYRSYEFIVGSGVTHYSQYKNVYNGSLAVFNNNTSDSIDGASRLYLTPMGGTNVKINFDAFVRQFHADHPYAVINYAELILPVAVESPQQKPDMIAAFKCYNDGTVVNIPDMYDNFTYRGYDGVYNDSTRCYRIRVTQHLQKILNSGFDLGTLLVINGRRSSAQRTIINGYDATATSGNPVCLRFVYSE